MFFFLKEKYRGRWLLTGDIARKDAEGYFYYIGRDDDLINTSGYFFLLLYFVFATY